MRIKSTSAISTYFCGLCVGAADIVPGISGGTVAFILGIYDTLLASIASCNKSVFFKLLRLEIGPAFRAINWSFLLPFLLGITTSFLLLATVVHQMLANQTYRAFLYAGFMGLVLGSALFIAKLLPKLSIKMGAWFFVGAVIAYIFSGDTFSKVFDESRYNVPIDLRQNDYSICKNVDMENSMLLGVSKSELMVMLAKRYISENDTVVSTSTNTQVIVGQIRSNEAISFINIRLVICGVIAVSAMLLPGISGSYMLQILGVYGFVLAALSDWTSGLHQGVFDTYSFMILTNMFLGIILGAICFSRVLYYLLNHYRPACITCLLGFMLGALGTVWPFWSYDYILNPTNLASGIQLQQVTPILPNVFSLHFVFCSLVFLTGIAIVMFVEFQAGRRVRYATKQHETTQSISADLLH